MFEGVELGGRVSPEERLDLRLERVTGPEGLIFCAKELGVPVYWHTSRLAF